MGACDAWLPRTIIFFSILIAAPIIPMRASAQPTSSLQVEIVGEGTVTPDSGVYTTGDEITLHAEPAPGWRFLKWGGDAEAAAEVRTLEMYTSHYLVAVFVERTETFDLDLVGDLGQLLHAAGRIPSASVADTMTIDLGGKNRDTGDAPDGIPDAAQFMMLQALLERASYDRTAFGGACNKRVWSAWHSNVMQARRDLPTASAATQRAIAAYMTLGSQPFETAAVQLAREAASAELSPKNYVGARNAPAALADTDGDGIWNRLEWLAVLEAAHPMEPLAAIAARFATTALDPQVPDRSRTDIAADLPDGDGANWKYDHLPHCEITFLEGDGLPIDVRLLDPPGREDLPLEVGHPVAVPLGAEILVTLAPHAQADWFFTWDAAGHMIDGSASKTERFRTMRDGIVRPVRRPTVKLNLPDSEGAYTWRWRAIGPARHLLKQDWSSGAARLEVPLGAFIELVAFREGAAGREYAMTWQGLLGTGQPFTAYGTHVPLFPANVASIWPDFDAPQAAEYLIHCYYSEGGAEVIFGMLNDDADPHPLNYATQWERVITPRPAPDDDKTYYLPRALITWPGFEVAGFHEGDRRN